MNKNFLIREKNISFQFIKNSIKNIINNTHINNTDNTK